MLHIEFENYTSKITATSPSDQRVNNLSPHRWQGTSVLAYPNHRKVPDCYTPVLWSWRVVLVSPYPSVRLSVCGQNRVGSVSSTILVGSISYLHILSSNFRRCVTCKVYFKISSFGKFFKFVTLTLSWLDPIWLNSIRPVWVIMGWQVVSSERRRSSFFNGHVWSVSFDK